MYVNNKELTNTFKNNRDLVLIYDTSIVNGRNTFTPCWMKRLVPVTTDNSDNL